MTNFVRVAAGVLPSLRPEVSLSGFGVFLAGVLSFASPCVLPLIPLYVAYLSGGTASIGRGTEARRRRAKTLLNTLCFVSGICLTFVLLGFAVSELSRFIAAEKRRFRLLSGSLILLFAFLQLFFSVKGGSASKEHRIEFRWERYGMSPWVAFVLGFTFSFAWTPCIGPQLAAVLSLAAGSGTRLLASYYMGLYCAGFILPFLLLGLFTDSALVLLKKNRAVMRYTPIVGAVLMIILGLAVMSGRLVF